MPVYTIVKENTAAPVEEQKNVSEEAIELVESAINQVINESMKDTLGKFGDKLDKAGASVKKGVTKGAQDARAAFQLAGEEISKSKAAKAVKDTAEKVADTAKNKATSAVNKAKGGIAIARRDAADAKNARKDKGNEAKREKRIAELESLKKKQNGELLPSHQKELDDLYAQKFSNPEA